MRKTPVFRLWSALVGLLAVISFTAVPAPAADFTRYHNYDDLTTALRELVRQHADLARLVEIGRSREGRTIWVVELANAAGTPVSTRPGLFVAANFEGDQVFGSEVALYAVDHLLGAYGSNSDVKHALDAHVIYVLPRANPDGAEMMFSAVKTGTKTNTRPYDNDNDGRIDEDGPEDLNGDGEISVMRVLDPAGQFMIHPEEPRLMRKADPVKGESGIYKIFWEGLDNDSDGFINEDPVGGVDLNRNFQHKYPYHDPDAGPHMVSEPESRAIMDFMIAHRNIATILTFGQSDNLITAPNNRGELGPPSTVGLIEFAHQSVEGAGKVGMFEISTPRSFGFRFRGAPPSDASTQRTQSRPRRPARQPEEKVNSEDIPYFQKIAEAYRELTGLRSAATIRTPGGAFFEYGYYQFGVPSFSTPCWGLPPPGPGEGGERNDSRAAAGPTAQSGGPRRAFQRGGPGAEPGGPSSGPAAETGTALDLRLLKWMDSIDFDGFIDWGMFDHPTLGEVEIGGFKPYATTNPPAEQIAESGEKHSSFILHLVSLFPEVSIAETRVTSLGGGLFRIKAEIENSGFLPTALTHGVVSLSVKPTMVQLDIDPDQLVSGDDKTSFFQTLAGSGSRQKYDWIIQGEPGATVTLKVVAQKGGTDTATLTLEQPR